MSNESIVSVPGNVENEGQTRKFLERLVVELDTVFGYRVDPIAKPISNFQKRQRERLSVTGTLNEQIVTLTGRTDDLDERLEAAEAAVEQIQQGTAIVQLTYTAVTVSATYTQSEVQQIADDVKIVADKLDSVINELQAAGILS